MLITNPRGKGRGLGNFHNLHTHVYLSLLLFVMTVSYFIDISSPVSDVSCRRNADKLPMWAETSEFTPSFRFVINVSVAQMWMLFKQLYEPHNIKGSLKGGLWTRLFESSRSTEASVSLPFSLCTVS